jgi:hypothetical protein
MEGVRLNLISFLLTIGVAYLISSRCGILVGACWLPQMVEVTRIPDSFHAVYFIPLRRPEILLLTILWSQWPLLFLLHMLLFFLRRQVRIILDVGIRRCLLLSFMRFTCRSPLA